jgi:hypothetical protein
MTIQLIYTTKAGRGAIRWLPDDEVAVRKAVESLCKRGVETTIRHDGVEIGGVWRLDGRWVYCYEKIGD